MSQSAQQQQQSASPGGLVTFEGFEGLDTQPSRYGLEAKKCSIFDGFFPAGPSNARIIPDNGPPLGSFTGGTILAVHFVTVNVGTGPLYFALLFLSDGSIWSYNTTTAHSSNIAPAGTVQNPSPLNIGVSQWGSQYALIVTNQTNGYFLWNGATFYTTGMAVPDFGTVPSGISGTTIETFGGYVWIALYNNLIWSAPGTPTDFTTASGGGSLLSNDDELIWSYFYLKQSNGYLFLFGDSSVSYLAGVTTTGSPPVTTFSLQTVDPEVGTVWPNTVLSMGSNIIFANGWGVHVSFGGRAAKVSAELDGIYNTQTAFFGAFLPSAAKAILFGKRVWCMLFPIIDQITMQGTFKLMIWDEKRWCTTPQSAALTFIAVQEINSLLFAWGTDGTNLFQLFNTPDTKQNKVLQSKFWAPNSYATNKTENRLWALVQLFSGTNQVINVSIDSENGGSSKAIAVGNTNVTILNNANQVVLVINSLAQPVTVTSSGGGGNIVIPTQGIIAQNGALVGFTIITNAQDLAIISMSTMPVDAGYRG